jgi:hypothetical protein
MNLPKMKKKKKRKTDGKLVVANTELALSK